MGAQVVAGVGFIGAGTILMTKRRRIRGLTTAAGLWVAAIVGLCCGAGFYLGAMYTTVLILAAEMVLSKFEYLMLRKVGEVNVYVEYAYPSSLDGIVEHCRQSGVKVLDVDVTRHGEDYRHSCAIFSLQMRRDCSCGEFLQDLTTAEGVLSAEEI